MYQIQFSRGLDALPLAKELRRKVFITEQGFQNEFDDIDRTAYRKQHIGSLVLKKLEEKARELGARELQLSAQVQAQGFYEKNGYQAFGSTYPDEHVPHISMKKKV